MLVYSFKSMYGFCYRSLFGHNLFNVYNFEMSTEWKGKPFPFSKGCSFYRLEVNNGKTQIT